MGLIEFNSSCYYRYANIDCESLAKNLGHNSDLFKACVKGFVSSFVKAVPTGKQNSMAAHNPPSYVRVILKDSKLPCSFANAFSKPVFVKSGSTLEEQSIEALEEYSNKIAKFYGDDRKLDLTMNMFDDNSKSLADLLMGLEQELPEYGG